MRLAVALALVVVAVVASPASAAPLPVYAVSPPNGITLRPSNKIQFSVQSDRGRGSLNVEVSRSRVLGQDGTLANDFIVGSVPLFESDATPGKYTGATISDGWGLTPGTYYWQIAARDVASLTYITSPTYKLTIGTPVAVFRLAEANRAALGIIRKRAGREPRGLHRDCTRASSTTFSCSTRWRDSRYRWRGALAIRARPNSYLYAFRGRRARLTCLRTKSFARCARRVSWG